jgi:hypothetical protein
MAASAFRLLLTTSLAVVLLNGAALAQQTSAASAPMGAASMPHNCKAMHGAGSDKPMPMMKSMNCAMDSAAPASEPTKKQRAKPAHDHSKDHKNQG